MLDDQNIVARITLTEGETIPDPLQEGIAMRETNRREYQNIPLPNSLKNQLLDIANPTQGISFKIAEGEALLKLGFASSRAEIAILEHQELHQLLFSNVVWSKQEELERKEGLFVKTLELAPPQEFMFKLCRKWRVMNMLNKIGFAKFIANDDAKKYATGSAFVAITCNKFDKYSFVKAGRAMERAWLLLNRAGVAVHPITATLFFGHRIRMNKMDSLNSETWTMMGEALDLTRSVFNVNDDEHIIFMFRVGYAKKPSENSSKKLPVVEYSK